MIISVSEPIASTISVFVISKEDQVLVICVSFLLSIYLCTHVKPCIYMYFVYNLSIIYTHINITQILSRYYPLNTLTFFIFTLYIYLSHNTIHTTYLIN